jgi:hypothetical protein
LAIREYILLAKKETFTGTIEEYNTIRDALDKCDYSLSTIKGTIQGILIFIEKSEERRKKDIV